MLETEKKPVVIVANKIDKIKKAAYEEKMQAIISVVGELHMPYTVYIVECADQTLYTGSTNDIEKRIHHHNHDKTGAKYTRARRPVLLIYSERVRSLSQALKREAEIKRMTRKKKLALIKI